MKTIKQIADEWGVSKDKVKYQARKLPGKYTSKQGNITYITDEGEAILKGYLGGKKSNDSPGKTGSITHNLPTDEKTFYQNQITAMQTTIEVQQQSIKELTAALEHTTASLHAAQALHAGTMQKQLTDGAADPSKPTEPVRGFFGRIFGRKKSSPESNE